MTLIGLDKIIFSYGGDSKPIEPSDIKDSLFLCHEATYLSQEDDERDFQQHSFLEEVLVNAKEANVETLLLIHTSLRYNLEEIYDFVNNTKLKLGITNKVVILFGEYFIDTDQPLMIKKYKNRSKPMTNNNSEEGNVR